MLFNFNKLDLLLTFGLLIIVSYSERAFLGGKMSDFLFCTVFGY